MAKEQRSYLYCIIEETEPQEFGIAGVGGDGDTVRTVHFKDLAAVVGRPPSELHALTREAAITHEKVIEEAMKRYTVLPVAFGVIAKSPAELKVKLLREKYGELKEALEHLHGKVELDLKAHWMDMDMIFKEIADELGVDQMKRTQGATSYGSRITIGEKVAARIREKKEKEAEEVVGPLTKLAEEVHARECQGERMVFNYAFLVKKSKERAFDAAVGKIAQAQASRSKLKYVVSPPYHFVNLRVSFN